jgi:SpoIID/LytB domain protein
VATACIIPLLITHLPIDSGSGKKGILKLEKKGISWGDLYPGIFQLRIVPETGNDSVLVDGIQYRGCIEIYPLKGKLHLVNEVDIDSYLKAILTSQFPNPIEEEAMQALAIAARTHVHFLTMKSGYAFWHIRAQEAGYLGYGLTFQHLHVDVAVEKTRRVILQCKSKPFPTAWTGHSGGKTASYSAIFRKDVFCPAGVPVGPALQDRPRSQWRFSISTSELAKLLNLNNLKNVELFLDPSSQKVYGARFFCGQENKDFNFFALQEAIGAKRLLSNDFSITMQGSEWTFSGYGEGHGVGICIYSAREMAKHGKNAKAILKNFFPGAETTLLPE